MSDDEIRTARLRLLDERLDGIHIQSERLRDRITHSTIEDPYTQLNRAELAQLEAEAELLHRERDDLNKEGQK